MPSSFSPITNKKFLDANGLTYFVSKLNDYPTNEVIEAVVDGVQDALDEKVDTSKVGAANGVASLGSDGKVPESQLPAGSSDTTYTLTQDQTDGHIIILTPSSGTAQTITIPDNNTWRPVSDSVSSASSSDAASSKAVKTAYDLAASKTANTGTVTKVSTGIGLTGGDVTTTGTVKAKLKSETAHTADSATPTNTANRQYAVGVDKSGYLSVNVPWTDTDNDTKNTAGSTDSSKKLFLIGAESQAANPQTYSHDTAYVGTDGCLYSGGTKVLTAHQDISGKADKSEIPTKVSELTNDSGYTTNVGTITEIRMNGASKGTSGAVDLGTVLTAHQDISGKADKSATVSNVAYDSTNKKLTKTINGTTSDVVTVATLKTAMSLAKGDVGLGNVENKSSATIRGEITSSNVTTALGFTPMNANLKGANSGVAELDENGKVPSSQLPSYVDDVLEYDKSSSFPTTGETGKIYIAQDTNKTYRWSGTAYVEISASLALGETSSTAYRGDRGKTAYDHASAKGSAFSEGLYKITTNAQGHVTAATAVAKADITALGIPGSDTNTHRPIQVNGTEILGNNTTALNLKAGSNVSVTNSSGTVTIAATDTTYSSKAAASGGTDVSLVTTGEKYTWNSKTSNTGTVTSVATGVGLTGGTITGSGTIKAKLKSETASTLDSAAMGSTASRQYAVGADKSGYLSVNIPWTDTNTKVTSAANHYAPSTVSGSDVTASASGATAAWSIDVVQGVTLNTDGKGHVTGMSVTSGKIPANPNSDTKVKQTSTSTNANYAVLFSATADSTTRTEGARKSAYLTYNPSTRDLVNSGGSLSLGRKTGTTIGTNSTAEGYDTIASNSCSHAEGNTTTASGLRAHAEGSRTTASGDCSHAEGSSATASGDYSHAEGLNTTAQRSCQHTFGKYNVLDTQGDNTTSQGKYIEIVGNGSYDDVRSNARALDWSGNEYLKGNLYVGCNADGTGGTKVATESFVITNAQIDALFA